MNKKEIDGHVEFARMFADVIGYLHGNAVEDIERVGDGVESLAEMFYVHGAKHALESQNVPVEAKSTSNPYPDMSPNFDNCVSALKAIRTWASYEDGIELVPDDVISLIDRTLRGVAAEKTHTWKSDKGWVSKDGKRVFEDG